MEDCSVNAISYSIFGDSPIYLVGALRNAEQVKIFYQDWQAHFWCECESITLNFMKELADRGAYVRPYSRQQYPNGMFVRFTIADDPTVERFICRDCDSRPSAREVAAVDEWIASRKELHILRDHPWHCSLLMGGLWGAVKGVLTDVESKIKSFPRGRRPYTRETTYGADQDFLVHYLWRKARDNSLIHDSFCRHGMTGVPFPDGLSEGDFVGSIYDEKDKPNAEHIKVRNEWIAHLKIAS